MAMPFQFRLEKVLSFKEREQDVSKERYNDAVNHVESVGRSLYNVLKEKEHVTSQIEQETKEGVSVRTIQQKQRYLQTLEQQAAQLNDQFVEAKKTMQEKQDILLQSTQEVKQFEKLKEKKYELYKEEVKSEDIKHLDEITLLKMGGRQQHG